MPVWTELALKVRAGDRAIDTLEQEINTECARVIAIRAPAASDLRTVLSVMKIAANLERCGDYAKNLAKRAVVLSQMPGLGGSTGAIRRLARSVQIMLHDALDGGGPASNRVDPLGKGMGQMLLDLQVRVPQSVAREALSARAARPIAADDAPVG